MKAGMKSCGVCLSLLFLLNFSFQRELMAGLGQGHVVQGHVVTSEELQHELAARSAQRLENFEEVQRLLRHDLVQKQLGQLVDLENVELALATLDDETLESLASESQKVNDQIEAGMATCGWVAIAAIAAFVIIIIIAASELN